MTRPCFLVVDREFSANISTRKLVIETSKFNVITAYSGAEAIDTLRRFPNVDAVVLDTGLRDMAPEALIRAVKHLNPTMPVILICGMHQQCPGADYHLEFFDTAGLVTLLQRLCPQAAAAVHQQDESLIRKEEELQ